MMPWETLGTIAEAIGYALSILGVVGIGWLIAGAVLKKLGLKNEEAKS